MGVLGLKGFNTCSTTQAMIGLILNG